MGAVLQRLREKAAALLGGRTNLLALLRFGQYLQCTGVNNAL